MEFVRVQCVYIFLINLRFYSKSLFKNFLFAKEYFDDGFNATCKACHPDCKTCNGTEMNNC